MNESNDLASVERLKARAGLAAHMTQAQQYAFEWPAIKLDAANDGRFTHAAHDKPGDQAWHVTLIVNATPEIPDAWPAWFAMCKYGMVHGGKVRLAQQSLRGRVETVIRPTPGGPQLSQDAEPTYGGICVMDWNGTLFYKARELLIRELKGVGVPERLQFWPENKVQLAASAKQMGLDPRQQFGFTAWLPMTEAEALACLPPAALEKIAPEYMKRRRIAQINETLKELSP